MIKPIVLSLLYIGWLIAGLFIMPEVSIFAAIFCAMFALSFTIVNRIQNH